MPSQQAPHHGGLPGNELLDQADDVLQGEAGRVGERGQVHGAAAGFVHFK